MAKTQKAAKIVTFTDCTLEIMTDYDGVFGSYVTALIHKKMMAQTPFKHKRIIVTSGAWRSYDVRWEESKSDPTVLEIDFYSVARHRGWTEEADEDLLNIM